MVSGLEQYASAPEILARRTPRQAKPRQDGPEPIAHASHEGYASKGDAFADRALSEPKCPICGGELSFVKWVNQGDHRYMNLAECPADGKLLLRIRFKHQADGSYSAACLAYKADEAMQEYYAAKAAQPRSRSRRRKRRKKA